MTPELREACRLARAAGALLVEHFRRPPPARAKTPTAFVSAADTAAETLLREGLARSFPGEPVLGEEGGWSGGEAPVWWTVDPLDGTSNFLGGSPFFAVSLARIEGGEVTLGVIHAPLLRLTFTALRGRGAFRGEERLRLRPPLDPRLALVAVPHGFVARHPETVRRFGTDKLRCIGSACLELAWTAGGGLHAVLARHLRLWDAAAGALLLREAGGAVYGEGGRPFLPLHHTPATYARRRTPLLGGEPSLVERLLRVVPIR